MAKKNKYYVVWNGREKGIFRSWDECKAQVDGFEGAQYKSFESQKEAEAAFKQNFYKVVGASQKVTQTKLTNVGSPIKGSVVVDAAWNTRSGDMEYQGFDFSNGNLLFKKGPFFDGTNNVGEFLAIVHALAHLKKHNLDTPIYSDSKTAISWVKKKKANTKLDQTPRNAELFELMERAEKWLKDNNYKNPILKWETKAWGENPADFGRK
ncbi:ribonuclease H1 domain-containing protein [Lacihabitans lacunae]|uniref:Ribonuclease H n=1 Tax=Lacihabitans lacunae TaxID=1028214 RepID=A0ABV7YWI1_9BACT